MKKQFIVIVVGMLATIMSTSMRAAKSTRIVSPNGELVVELNTGKGEFGWMVSRNGKLIYRESNISLTIGEQTLGGQAAIKGVKQKTVTQTIQPVVSLKFSSIKDEYTEATINFGTYQVLLRVMDNAVAHRFVTKLKGEVEVKDEKPAE